MENFISVFAQVEDPRADNSRHELLEILFVALAAVLCGAEGCADMAEFGLAKEDVLRQVLRLEHGVPSHDTFSRVFRQLDPAGFERAFRQFMAAFAENVGLAGVVAVDGKAVRGAFERGARTTPLHLVNVWAVEQRLAIAQHTAPGRNEVAGAIEVVKLLSLRGCIVTADALHCHRAFAQAVLDQGGEFVLALKENQSAMLATATQAIDAAAAREECVEEPSAGHDRVESRRAVVVHDTTVAERHAMPGVKALARVESVRKVNGKPEEVFIRYFLLSSWLSAAKLLNVVRTHWTIENQLHWVLDVVFDEDRARNRKDHGPENLAILRKIALNILRTHPAKSSLRRKVKRAGWNDAFLLSLLGHMR